VRVRVLRRRLKPITGIFLLPVVILAVAATQGIAQQTYSFGRITLFVGGFTNGVVSADFNGDGRPDLAVSYFSVHGGQTGMAIYLGQAAGGFVYSGSYEGYEYFALATGDFNGDGKPDLAVISGALLLIYLGNGDGTFKSPINTAIPFNQDAVDGTGQIAVGDFNGDGKLDVALVDGATLGTGTDLPVTILLGNGDGTFQPPTQAPDTGSPTSIVAGDFNGDGKLDLATNDLNSGNVSVLLGNGDGTFQAPVSTNVAYPAQSLVAADFNKNGALDLALENVSNGSNSVVILLGNGNGTFQVETGYPAGTATGPLATADLNADGNPDLVSANGSDAYVLLGNGDGTFQLQNNYNAFAVPYPINTSVPSGIVIADFNGDGAPDLAFSDNGGDYTPILFGRGDGTFGLRNDYIVGGDIRAYGISTADFIGSGTLDLAVPGTYFSGLFTLLGSGNGTFQTPILESGLMGSSAAPGDFNGDGKADLAFSEVSTSNAMAILLSNGDGTFTAAGTQAGQFDTPAVADFNGDGKLDVAGADEAANNVAIMLGNGDGTIQAAQYYATASEPMSVAVADFNGDGISDLAVTTCGSGLVSILLGNGDGTFKTHVDYPGGGCASIATGDFNNDGKIDLALAGVYVLLGNGDGTFQAPVNYLVPNAGQLVAADFNADGNLDLAVVEDTANVSCEASPIPPGVVSVLPGNGDGTFQPHTDYATLACPVALALGDFNGDGAPDLAVLEDQNEGGNNIASIMLNGPFIALLPTALTFAAQSIGTASASQTITITNPSAGNLSVSGVSASGDYSETNNCPAALASQATCAVTVTFTPTMSGTRTGAISITDTGANSPQSIALTGTGGTEVSVTPASLTFGLQAVGTVSAPQVVTLTNTSNVMLEFTAGSTITGPDSADFQYCAAMHSPGALCYYESAFADCGVTMSLYPGGSCVVGIAFDPTAGGTRSATLSFNDNAAGSPQTVPLGGTAPLPAVTLSPSGLNFADQPAGTASTVKTVTLTNSGDATLSIASIVANGDFAVANTCKSSLAPGLACVISVVFKPSASGTLTGTVTISDNAGNSPQSIALTGTGTSPAVTLTPNDLSFGPVLAGASVVATPVLLTNSGTAPLSISSIAFTGTDSGDFSQQNNCGSTVAAGTACTIDVTFKPTAGGSLSATLAVADNASGSPQTVGVSGTGEDFTMTVVGSSSASVTPGQTATYALSVSPTGGLGGTVTLACSGAPASSTCMLAPSKVNLNVMPVIVPSDIVVSVSTSAGSLSVRRPAPSSGPWQPGPREWILVLATLAAVLAAARTKRRHAWLAAALLGLFLATSAVITSCGGVTSMPSMGTPAGTYTLTVTGAYASGSASLQNSVRLSLTVQ
jgi:FG-GAP-like repeat/Abnormal spindle-like microcephaly-assoc'd, ASPM-SPD-2-Hydin/FG-GAP repeat